jgi:hypothetical protein
MSAFIRRNLACNRAIRSASVPIKKSRTGNIVALIAPWSAFIEIGDLVATLDLVRFLGCLCSPIKACWRRFFGFPVVKKGPDYSLRPVRHPAAR